MITGPCLHLPQFNVERKGDRPRRLAAGYTGWLYFDLPLCFITPLGAIRQKVKAI